MNSRVGGKTTLGTIRVTRCLVGRKGVKWVGVQVWPRVAVVEFGVSVRLDRMIGPTRVFFLWASCGLLGGGSLVESSAEVGAGSYSTRTFGRKAAFPGTFV